MTARVWYAEGRGREEVDRGEGIEIGVHRGRIWWHYHPDHGARSNEQEVDVGSDFGRCYRYLVEGWSLLGSLSFEPGRDTKVAGRAAAVAIARPRRDEHELHSSGLFRIGAGDEYELAIDRETGMLLRVVVRHRGEDVSRTEVVELSVNQPIDDALFTFVPPPGEEVQGVDLPQAEHVRSLSELAQRAPFAVFAPAPEAPGWRRDLTLFRGAPGYPLQATLAFHCGHAQFQIAQTPAATPDVILDEFVTNDQPEAWHEDVRSGRRLLIRQPQHDWEPTMVRLELDGTGITLSSADLDANALVEVAARLQRVPAQPPRYD
jgi:hypothetical protein